MNAIAESPLFVALMVFAGSGTVAAAISAWAQRKNVDASEAKVKADAAKVISDTATARMLENQQEMSNIKAMLRMHREWDRQVVKRYREHGLEIDDPPELWF
jgi:hypothetical protein